MGRVQGSKKAETSTPDTLNELQFAEKVSAQALADARKSYDALYERVLKLVTLVSGAAGAAGVFVLGKLTANGVPTELWPLAALSSWWFVIAAGVLLRGARSRHMTTGTSGMAVGRRFTELRTLQGKHALWHTRWEHLAAEDLQIKNFAAGTSARSKILDIAYDCLVASPGVAGLAYVLTWGR